jgi:hypothetical protein
MITIEMINSDDNDDNDESDESDGLVSIRRTMMTFSA